MGLFSTLGTLAGLFVPGVGPLMGAGLAGIGSFLDGDSPKQAIKNAVLAGVGNKFLSSGIQGTKIGGAITGSLANAGIGTAKGIADLAGTNATTALTSQALTSGAGQVAGLAAKAAKPEGSSLFSPFGLAATSIGLAAIKDQNAKDTSHTTRVLLLTLWLKLVRKTGGLSRARG
jgi:hypothetical protein